MNWNVGGHEYPVIPLAILLGGVSALAAVAVGVLLQASTVTIIWLGTTAGALGALALLLMFLADVTLTAKAEGETKRARLRAARRIYQAWATGSIEPPVELKTATYRVDGEVRTLEWLMDDDPEARRWRSLLVTLFQYGRACHRESKGARTGLTEADLVGETPSHMFYGRDGYLLAIKIAKELGLVERLNGVPTRLQDGWTWTKVIGYLQTSAVLPPIHERAPSYRAYKGVG